MPANLLKGPIAKLVASALKGAGMTLAATLIKVTPGTRTAGKISAGTNPTSTSYQCVGFVDVYSTFELAQSTVIKTDDRKICLLGATIQGGQIPRPTDKIFIDGLTYEIQNVSRDPASATYECQSRLSTLPVVVVPLPTAAFSSVVVGLVATFSDLSFAPSGSIVAWSWAFGDGGTSTVQSPAHTYASGGIYTVTLIVTDTHGGHATIAHATTANSPPIAAFTPSIAGLLLTCVDSSTDADGTIVSWQWTFGDGGSSAVRNPSYTYTASGTFTVTLVVTDNGGLTATVNHNVTAAAGLPIASFTDVVTGLSVAFTDTSTDSTATITGWAWTFGDGGTSTLQSPTHVYATAGTFTVNLTITDTFGAQSSATPASVTTIVVTRDGPLNLMRPASLAEWRLVGGGLLAPDYYWRFGDLSGNAIDDVQGAVLAAFGTPLYQQALSGWTAKGVGTVNGTATQGFGAAVATLYDVAHQSILIKLDAAVASLTTARDLLIIAGGNELIDITLTGHIAATPVINGTINYVDGLVHSYIVEVILGATVLGHTGAGLWRISTEKEQITGTWAGKIDNVKGIGAAGLTGVFPPTATFMGKTVWVGSKAEAMSVIGPKAILQQFGNTVTGY